MDSFFQVYEKAIKKYSLSRIVNLSIYEGCEMRIYRDDALIIIVKSESQEELYRNAASSLEKYLRLHSHIERSVES